LFKCWPFWALKFRSTLPVSFSFSKSSSISTPSSLDRQLFRDQDESGSLSSDRDESKENKTDLDEEGDCNYPVFNDIDENSNDEDRQPNLNESSQNISSGVLRLWIDNFLKCHRTYFLSCLILSLLIHILG
jgi:hypothetical protein